MLSNKAHQEPVLTNEELQLVNEVIQWFRTHEKCMYFDVLATVPRLMEFVYEIGIFGIASRPAGDSTRIPINLGHPAMNTRGATLQKDKGQAQVADNGKSKNLDEGKAKTVETEKPKKHEFIPLRIGQAFKIYEQKDLVPLAPPATEPMKKSLIMKKKLVDTPHRVARILKLVDEAEDTEA